jgi:hypothetical protein
MFVKISCKISMAEALRYWEQNSYLQKRCRIYFIPTYEKMLKR